MGFPFFSLGKWDLGPWDWESQTKKSEIGWDLGKKKKKAGKRD